MHSTENLILIVEQGDITFRMKLHNDKPFLFIVLLGMKRDEKNDAKSFQVCL